MTAGKKFKKNWRKKVANGLLGCSQAIESARRSMSNAQRADNQPGRRVSADRFDRSGFEVRARVGRDFTGRRGKNAVSRFITAAIRTPGPLDRTATRRLGSTWAYSPADNPRRHASAIQSMGTTFLDCFGSAFRPVPNSNDGNTTCSVGCISS